VSAEDEANDETKKSGEAAEDLPKEVETAKPAAKSG
jgi:hypothetical protein